MNVQKIKELLQLGEGIRCEFKEARERLPKNFFETVCAFLNTEGGMIVLGVDNNGMVTGIDESVIENVKKDLVTLSNNPQKLNPPYLLFPETYDIDDKKIIAVSVPLSSQLHTTAGEIFLRSEDGDF